MQRLKVQEKKKRYDMNDMQGKYLRKTFNQQLEKEIDELTKEGWPSNLNDRGHSSATSINSQNKDYETDRHYTVGNLEDDMEGTSKQPIVEKSNLQQDMDQLLEDASRYQHKDKDLQDHLRVCFGKYGITRNAQDDILKLLNANGHEVPCSSRTLMGTPRSVASYMQRVSNGHMYYSGISSGLRLAVTEEYLSLCKTIELDFFWDGLSPYSSVKCKVWPILCRLSSTSFSRESSPFIVAVFGGKSDPNPQEFLKDFVSEAKSLQINGITINGMRYEVRFQKFIADYPARCRMKCVNGEGPSSLVQCERCTIVGKKRQGTQFSQVEMRKSNPTLRTDETFRQRHQREYHWHSKTGARPDSPLMLLDIDMVFDFPMDPMHILYQGILRRWWEFIVETKRSVAFHITDSHIQKISQFMENEIGMFFPSEYARRVRGLSQFKLFKATEWRRFLLYDGVLITKKFLLNAAYRNFLLLSCAVRILSSPDLFRQKDLVSDAQRLLHAFVLDAESHFGKSFIAIKVHSLLHLVQDCEKHGVLEGFSAFPFESYLNRINNAMRAHGRCIEQIVCRIKEGHLLQPTRVSMRFPEGYNKAVLTREISKDAVGNEREYMEASLPGIKVCGDKRRDSIVRTINNEIVKVTSILHDIVADEMFVVGHRFLHRKNFFHWPIKSEVIGIVKVWGLESSGRKWPLSDVKCKCALLPIDSDRNEWLCLPLVHTESG